MARFSSGLVLALYAVVANASPKSSLAQPDAKFAKTVTLNGESYINKGLVGFGLIPSNFVESTGDTLGGFGSGVAIKLGTWEFKESGKYEGTLVVVPDRGYNVETTIDWQARRHEIKFELSPHYSSKALSFEASTRVSIIDAQKTLELEYQQDATILEFERNGVPTTGLDGLGVRPANNATQDPELPIANATYNRLSVDIEGIVLNPDGTYWLSDEYGPYIYKFSQDGKLLQTIQPPNAILPRDKNGALSFTSDVDPATGRSPNQGFEGLTVDRQTNTLYAMLQSATIQDGGADKKTSKHTRMVAYNVSTAITKLVGEWVVPLPSGNGGKTRGQSEIQFVSPGVFLVLARDGNGRGTDDDKIKYKQADLVDISGATDIHGTKYDEPSNPVSPGGVLNKDITPATYVSFVDFVDKDQLERFGLHNDSPNNSELVNAKWESLAIAPCDDPDFPHDYFLFSVSDNDFISTEGISLGKPFDAGLDVDSQFFVFRVTLPTVEVGSVHKALGIRAPKSKKGK